MKKPMASTADLRKPAVAGTFYPSSEKEITALIKSFLEGAVEKKKAIACLLPHAGYIYSGKVAALTAASVEVRERAILIGPNHTGRGSAYSVMAGGAWQTPMGAVNIDSELARTLLKNSRYLKEDALAHRNEYSLEVELPILQYFRKDLKIVPITIMSEEVAALKGIGKEIAQVLESSGIKEKVLIVASSDMTHYEPALIAQSKDKEAIKAIIELDEDKLAEKVIALKISMCGYAPAIVMLSAAKALGAKSGQLISYQTSAEVTGDTGSVVGYAGIVVY